MPFRHELRVRYGECDPQGIVFNANYVAFFDVAFTELFRAAGIPWATLTDRGLDAVVAHVACDFRAPARFDDVLQLDVTVEAIGTTSTTTRIDVLRGDEHLLTGRLRHVFVDAATWRKTPVPDWVRAALAPHAAEPASPSPPATVDGVLVDAPAISVRDAGLLRGDGAFEVVRLYGGRPFALEDHLERLARSCAGLRLVLDLDEVRADIATLLGAAGDGDAILRYVVTRGGRRIGLVEPLPRHPASVALRTVTFAPTRLLDGIKSLSYAANVLATRLAAERGGDEALLVTPHGRVLEGPTSSLFVAFDERTLVTPPLGDHVLDSITRRRLLGLVAVEERPLALDDLRRAREAFLASTTREVHPVARVDDIALPAVPGPLTRAAAGALAAHVREALR